MHTGLPPIVLWAEGDCLSALFASGSFFGETVKLKVNHFGLMSFFVETPHL
jgi:hypothetical protein